jgi:hypothetical protein
MARYLRRKEISMENVWPKYEKSFYFHFRDNNQYLSGVTVCMKPQSKGEKVFRVGVSCCTPQDNFSKRVGRYIAEGRANISDKTIEAANLDELRKKAELVSQQVENAIMSRKNVKA